MRLKLGLIAVAAAFAFGASGAAAQQAGITGQVTDDSGAAVASAQVVITHQSTGAQSGGLTSADGRYSVTGLRAGGPYLVDVRSIGYGRQAVEGVMLQAGQTLTLDFRLTTEAIAIDALEVFATRAQDRQTPVAFSNVSKVQIQQQLGSRDLPLVLNVTPSVYATQQGGGAGDARINVRGFNQRNTAVMINGVPVNDMENGWVYWSNWDGVGDAATSIQLQRGLSAVNLATPSIGGTLNVITDPSANTRGFSYKQEFGLGRLDENNEWGLFSRPPNLMKETFVANTGEINGFAATASVVRKTGTGMFSGFQGGDATWTDAWAYYLATSYQVNARNRLEFYAVGAPQRHGQNLDKLNIGTISHDFAQSLDSYDAAALTAFPEAGRRGSPNVAPVTVQTPGYQFNSTGPGGLTERYSQDFINERENYFHKPQLNLNWYSYLGEGLSWTTVGYYSGGKGGGTGTYGSLVWDYTYTQRFPNWDATITDNIANAAGGTGSRGIIRNSVNNQDTFGAISKLRKDFDSGWTGEFGLDWRTADIEHYREVRDLLGGLYYDDCRFGCSSDFWTGSEGNRRLGDKINYHNENTVNWLGAYVQAEKASAEGSLYGMAGWSQNSYTFEDFFTDDGTGNPLVVESGNIRGYQLKGGAVRNLTQEWSVFGNAGYVSKVPIFDGVIDDNNGTLNPDPQNEKFLSFEAGAQYRSLTRGLSFDVNVYHTTWKDRTETRFVQNIGGVSGVDGLINLLGVDARHMGVEIEGAVQPSDMVRFDAAVSLGNWKYLNDVSGTYAPDDQSTATVPYDFYIGGLKVGDAPQRQIALSGTVFPADGLYVSAVAKIFGDHYSDYEPFGRTDPMEAGIQPWQPPGYTVFDLHSSYSLGDRFSPAGGDVRLFVNIYNVFDKLYIQDAVDNSRFNSFDGDHDADDAEVFFGYPRNLNVGFQIAF